jgi:hypothetical protein
MHKQCISFVKFFTHALTWEKTQVFTWVKLNFLTVFNKLVPERKPHQISHLVDLKLSHQVDPVPFDRLHTERQGRRDLMVGLSKDNQIQNFLFSGSKRSRFSFFSVQILHINPVPRELE